MQAQASRKHYNGSLARAASRLRARSDQALLRPDLETRFGARAVGVQDQERRATSPASDACATIVQDQERRATSPASDACATIVQDHERRATSPPSRCDLASVVIAGGRSLDDLIRPRQSSRTDRKRQIPPNGGVRLRRTRVAVALTARARVSQALICPRRRSLRTDRKRPANGHTTTWGLKPCLERVLDREADVDEGAQHRRLVRGRIVERRLQRR